jgi:hypothetical protein
MSSRNRGLDLSALDSISEEEVDGFRGFYKRALGGVHRGFDFWIQAERPDILKRYRQFAELPQPGGLETNREFTGFGFLQDYALSGYDVGVRYLVHIYQQMGLTRSQVLEGIAIAFLHCGPRGMETIAIALEDYKWIDPEDPPTFPKGWVADPEAFNSGLDFSTPLVKPGEIEELESWYRTVLGEVPEYVQFLSHHRPEILKSYRDRYEHILVDLPKQVMPYTLLHHNVIRGFSDGVRENVLLAKGFGLTKDLTLRSIYSAMLYGGPEAMSLVSRSAGDVLAEEWPSG